MEETFEETESGRLSMKQKGPEEKLVAARNLRDIEAKEAVPEEELRRCLPDGKSAGSEILHRLLLQRMQNQPLLRGRQPD